MPETLNLGQNCERKEEKHKRDHRNTQTSPQNKQRTEKHEQMQFPEKVVFGEITSISVKLGD